MSFSDLYKPIKNLFEKDYQKDSLSFTTKAKVNNDLSGEFSMTEKLDHMEGHLSFIMKNKFEPCDVSVTTKLFNKGNITVTEETDFRENGLKLKLHGGLLAGADNAELAQEKEEKEIFRDHVESEVSYSHKYFKGTIGVSKKRKNPLKVVVSGATDYQNFVLGAEVQFNNENGFKPIEYSVIGGLTKEKLNVRALVKGKDLNSKPENIKLGTTYDFQNNLTGGVEFSHDLSKNATTMKVGAQYQVDKEQTVKFNMTQDLKTQIAYIVNLNKNLKANLTLETSLKALRGNASTSKVSVGFNFEP